MRIIQHTSYGPITPKRGERDFYSRPKTVIIEGVIEYFGLVQAANALNRGQIATIPLQVGISRVHTNDDFIRREGLRLARLKVRSVEFKLTAIGADKDGITCLLESEHGHLELYANHLKGQIYLRGEAMKWESDRGA